ncbi:ClpXP protease specificity-enhancing factor [Gilliamella sp. Choc4-2]|uniref:ClpXP protease specificity-enhancing factor n=1 Tax=unclassified Gilliamella TaxID=2685620 RepID=UPI0004DD65C6|nr:ClpXP protease specificity-enhancing factor [Gilliamella apicola]KFA59332.1 Stringent starvation protein B [Gilliamella apicola]OCG32618.1 ClpXP protease specificity-enhancing factor [Gilliamella apicola]OCG46386.1 ClpXP protease specificity-enhancing factor [Gilliamella apicola]OCG53738.1 ClpXP protease specificity-enhancing factor [Gilliamella apicola]OCG64284.1 ClpXP protease specificity-enhancing factor [Gilliamella apicola]
MDPNQMSARRPYLFRAFYDWILDNELTPYIVVDTKVYGVVVPQEFVKNNQIVLNIAPHSVGQYSVTNEKIEFNARFSGVSQHIVVPIAAIKAIYARENGVGMGFEDEPQYQVRRESLSQQPEKSKPKPNPFRVVK